MYRLRSDEAGMFEAGPFEVVLYDPTDERQVEDVSSIHYNEAQRIGRSALQHRALFSLPRMGTLLSTTGKKVSAYLTYGHSMNKPGLIEAGGEIEGIETLVRYLLQQDVDEGETQAIVRLSRSGLDELLEREKPGTRRPVEEADGVGSR